MSNVARALQGIYEGAYIDVLHWDAAKTITTKLFRDLEAKKGKPNSLIDVQNKYLLNISFTNYYTVDIPASISYPELRGVALGIFKNFENKFESFEYLVFPTCLLVTGKEGSFLPRCSAFSNEDLPSDYLGFVAAERGGWSIVEVANKLGGGTRATVLPPELAGTVYDAMQCLFGDCGGDTPYNKCFTSFKLLDLTTKKYVHRPLPDGLDGIVYNSIEAGKYWKEFDPSQYNPYQINK